MTDLRFSLRSLRRSWPASLLIVGMLGLGIGAATAVFSTFDALLLRPLPGAAHPEQLVSLETVRKGVLHVSLAYPDYRDYRDRSRSFASIAARNATWVSLRAPDGARRVVAELVTGNYFSTLAVSPAAGRLIGPGEGASSSAPFIAVLSDSLWRSSFASDPSVVGKVVQINGYPFQVIGIAPRAFRGTVPNRSTAVFLPLGRVHELAPRLFRGILENRASLWLGVFGRLKSAVSLSQAQAEIDTLTGQIVAANPITNEGRSIHLLAGLGYDSEDRATLNRLFLLLLAGVGLLLLIVCGNVANLLLARGAGRRREIAIRLSLGCSRRRLIRQLTLEATALGIAGGVVGVLLAPWLTTAFGSLPQSQFGFQSLPFSLDWRVAAFAIVITVTCCLLSSLAPALRSTSPDLVDSLKNGSAGAGLAHSGVFRSLVMLQVGISFVLLVSAGLLVRSMRSALQTTAGFRSRGVLLASLDLGIQGYSEAQGQAFYRRLLEGLRQSPGVLSASLSQTAPASPFDSKISVFYPGQAPPPEQRAGRIFDLGVRTDFNPVSPRYFESLSIPLVRGRDFQDSDDASAPDVCILSQSLASRLWPDGDAVGRWLDWPPDNGAMRHLQVVGVVGDVRHRSPLEPAPLMLYVPIQQQYDARATILLRYRGEASAAEQALVGAVAALDPSVPVFSLRTLDEQVGEALWQQSAAARLIGLFGALAVVLAAAGLYGVMSYLVARRTREIGVRLAIGAQRNAILALVLRQSLRMVWIGLALGLAASFAAARILRQLVTGISRVDAGTVLLAAGLLSVVGLLAAWLPALHASHLDPVVALHHE